MALHLFFQIIKLLMSEQIKWDWNAFILFHKNWDCAIVLLFFSLRKYCSSEQKPMTLQLFIFCIVFCGIFISIGKRYWNVHYLTITICACIEYSIFNIKEACLPRSLARCIFCIQRCIWNYILSLKWFICLFKELIFACFICLLAQ